MKTRLIYTHPHQIAVFIFQTTSTIDFIKKKNVKKTVIIFYVAGCSL